MPSLETLERFIARVEENAHAEAIAEFYTEGASMQENAAPPRVGRDNLVANERKVLARAKAVTSQCVRPAFVNGERVVIRWIFEFRWLDGSTFLRSGAESRGLRSAFDHFTAMREICSSVGHSSFSFAARVTGGRCCTVVRAGGTSPKKSL